MDVDDSSASTGPRLFLLSLMPMRVPTQTKTQEREVVGLCQKSAGLCLEQTPQPRKTAHWLKGGEGGQQKLPRRTKPDKE